ncbi:hypothetical protein M2317_000471 [Microbacterium sp. ZKA21]|uniref:hypothetical protein n=1 Tax=Microbacterium sp. ZKA21 TaxID=3381694 RepID=UPI003D23C4CB
MSRPRILCISFSDITADSRVLRQLGVLQEFGEVTTLAYGPRPENSDHHLELPSSLPSLPQTPSGVVKLLLRRYRSVATEAPAIRAALKAIDGQSFDIVVANEARALPLAFRVEGSPRIWCDLHEWAPEERTHVLSWRLLVAPFMRWICAEYLPRADAATTVNRSIAEMYGQAFGVLPDVVRNAIPYRSDLIPTALEPQRVRLVHSGGAVPGRNIEALIDGVELLGDGCTLDLYLIGSRQGDTYWRELSARIEASERTTLHPPVAPDLLPDTLNAYDLGVFLLPPHTPNHRYMLPNKFFDFVQARLGLVFGPSVETDRLIRDEGLGVITDGYSAEDFASAIRALTPERITAFKRASDSAAVRLSSEEDIEVERRILRRLGGGAAA